MNTNTEIITTSGASAAEIAPAGTFTLAQLTAAGNNLTRGLVACGQQMLHLQDTMLRGVVALGFAFVEAKRTNPRGFTKLFLQAQNDVLKPGMFGCTYATANKYIKTAAAIWERARAAGKAADLEAQVAAFLVDAQTFEAPQRDIPVLRELVDTEWVSLNQVMVELGVLKPGKHRALVTDTPAPSPVLPGLEEYCQQAWENTSSALGVFRELMQTDIPRLNAQQRHTLRDELRAVLDELDRIEAAAPALD